VTAFDVDAREEAARMAREIVEAAPHGIVLLDLDGVVLEVNPATERLLRFGRDEIVGNSCQPFTHPEDHELETPYLKAVLEGTSDGYTIEKRYLRKGSTPIWARMEMRVIRDERGEPLRLLALIEDISARRRAEFDQRRLTEELIEHRDTLQRALDAAGDADEQVRTILECVTDGFVALDTEWRYTYVNKRAGELFGRKPEDLLGKKIWEEFPEGVGQPFHDAYQKAMAERTTISLVEYYPPWDRWFENRIYGSRTGVAIYFTDVTERRRVEELERRQRDRTETVRAANEALTRTLDLDEVLGVLLDSLAPFVAYSSASVLLHDGPGLSLAAKRGHGALDGDATARRVADLRTHPQVRRVLEEGRPAVVDDTEREPEGEPLLAQPGVRSWIAVPLRAGGQVIGLCSLESREPRAFGESDVDWAEALTAQAAAAIEHARLHAELQRHAAELEQRVAERTEDLRAAVDAAERANRAKSEFLAGISHELRTPMNAILGFAQLLELDELADDQGDNVRQILRAGRHLLELITELLDIARIEAGELALSLEPVSLDDLLSQAVDLTRPLAEQLGVTVSLEGEVDGYLLADRQRVLQVLLNLLANAAKYNRSGGSVVVGCREDGARVAISVTDNGHGIALEDVERLFVPFDRLGLEAGAIEGAGLGLALARRLVEAMDGTISVASTIGVGSTFIVELPRADDPLAALAAAEGAPAPAARHTATILYIEDNLANLQLVERVLARQPGLTMLKATDGARGLELARERRPDLVLLDLHLPDTTGEEVLDELKASPDTAGIPVVVVSAAASKGRVQRLRQRGAREYLTKPIDIVELLTVVDATLGARAS
jgi:PAS domain S-box-containing protein